MGSCVVSISWSAAVQVVTASSKLLLCFPSYWCHGFQGVKNVADAAASAGSVNRVVLVSSMLTHPANR